MQGTKLRRQQESAHRAFRRQEQRVRAVYLSLEAIAKRAVASLLRAGRAFSEALREEQARDDDLIIDFDQPPEDMGPP